MRKKPVIGIVARPNTSKNQKIVLGVYENYANKIIRNGGIPFLLLNSSILEYEVEYKKELKEEEKNDLKQMLNQCDGILMPGGMDGYQYDYFITNYAMEHNIPLLGICLGMQLMAECLGGRLKETLNHYLVNHEVFFKEHSKLEQIYQTDVLFTNSRHRYQVVDLDSKYISGLSRDGVVEAIEVEQNDFCIGVQWHPEDLNNHRLFQQFIEAAIQYKRD